MALKTTILAVINTYEKMPEKGKHKGMPFQVSLLLTCCDMGSSEVKEKSALLSSYPVVLSLDSYGHLS